MGMMTPREVLEHDRRLKRIGELIEELLKERKARERVENELRTFKKVVKAALAWFDPADNGAKEYIQLEEAIHELREVGEVDGDP